MKNLTRSVAVLLAVCLLAACGEDKEIVIGVAGPMTGSEAAIGEQMSRGAKKAVEDINAAGGINGRKVHLNVADDACDPKQAVTVANDFVSEGAVMVAGHYCSGASIPASDVYADSGIVQITPASTNPQFTERGLTNVFRVCGRDDEQGPTAAKYIAAKYPDARIAIVNDKSTYGKGLADEFQEALHKLGKDPVLVEAITARETDYSALVTKLRQANADILYFGGYKTEAGLIVRQMRQAGLSTILVGGDALVTEEFWAITGDAGAGTLMTFGPDPRLNPKNADLVAWFRKNNYEPEAYTLYTYAAVQAWAEAARKAGTVDPRKVADELRKGTFDTALGTIDFDDKGDNSSPGYVFYVWKDGKYVYAD
ncbi:MAG: ABC transporter substrate-binding protein [Alphaproteobacteria bacterium]|nr:ABC transporter substrate-binding protein [Alphaproteobacteria bacterium]